MKTKLIRTLGAIVFVLFVSVGLFGQVAEVGILRNGTPVVTNLANATTVLKAGLSNTATISNISILLEHQSGKYFLIGYVQNDQVTGKAVELQLGSGGALRAVGGPGLEVTCTGIKCGRCVPKITKGIVRCVCEDPNPPGDMECNMQTKVVLSLW